jgi:histidinol-phosphate aminotransferase
MSGINRRRWLQRSLAALTGAGLTHPVMARAQSINWPSWLEEEEVSSSVIRIGQNENPYGPSPRVLKAMQDALTSSNRYPGDAAQDLKEAIANQYGLSADYVLLGAGSSELLGNTAAIAALQQGNVVTADPTFRLWFGTAELFGLSIKKVPLTSGKVHDLEAMLAAVDDQTRMVYVVNPHNPTGTVLSDKDLRRFADAVTSKSILLMDEAYTEYCEAETLAPMVRETKNLVVAKTFSKIHALAGARVGFALAHPEIIKKLSAWQPWANAGPSAVSLAAARAALTDIDFMKASKNKTAEVRRYVTESLRSIGYTVIPSSTSFIYYDVTPFRGDLSQSLQKANITGVRIFEANTGWRRTSLGTMEEMEAFLKVVRAGT